MEILRTREGSEQRDDGIVPFNAFLESDNDDNFVKRPISRGIVEVNKLSWIDNSDNCVMSPISLGIVEVNKLL
jgi:hypothetical protein